jgi:lipopolysaccharide export LptBFGC system permease protein LptF
VEGHADRKDPLLNGHASPFSFWTSAAPWLALLAFALAFALLHARPHERTTFLNTLWLFLVGLAGEAAASLVWVMRRRGMKPSWIACWVTENAPEITAWLAMIVAMVASSTKGSRNMSGAR